MKLDKNYKVRVTPEQSREIQELVFGLGGKWNGGTDWVINEIIPFLYVTSGLVMTCDSKAQEYFGYASSENTEILATELIAKLEQLTKNDKTMKLDDFLKCKKVRCVNNGGLGHLTEGKEYEIKSIDYISVFDNDGDSVCVDTDWFEPVLDSAENPLQDVELTPEFEALDKPQPDWSKAPKGYDWWAKDKDGVAYWFDDLPRKQGDCWGGPCNFEETTIYLNDKPWHESLERRPKSEQVPITGKLNTETVPIASTDDLHPEFEALAHHVSEPKFQVGNKVYKYGETDVKTVLEVFEDGYMRISNYPHRVNHEVICHATPENHAVLSKPFPAIKFEQPPKELAGSDLAKALIEKGWVGFNCLCGHSGDENAITDTIVTGINEGGQFTTIDGRLFSNAIPMKGWRPLKAQEVSL